LQADKSSNRLDERAGALDRGVVQEKTLPVMKDFPFIDCVNMSFKGIFFEKLV